jgi:5-methylcytosine-specific restriction endonuclease McrA
VKKWRTANPGAKRAIQAKRRALKISQRCTCCTDAEIKEIHDIAALCGSGAHVDHIVQLSLGGPDCVKNLRPMTASEHIEKTKIDARERATSRLRNKLLLQWGRAAPAPTFPRLPAVASPRCSRYTQPVIHALSRG